MSELIFRRLEVRDEATFIEAYKTWDADPLFPLAYGYEPDVDFSDYVEYLKANERGERLPPGFVPATTIFAFEKETLVGRLSLRHRLNDFLLQYGGHVGYGVVPAYRRKGHAKALLAHAIELARHREFEEILVTCDDDNIGSIKTIEAFDAKLENKVPYEGRALRRRYWIKI